MKGKMDIFKTHTFLLCILLGFVLRLHAGQNIAVHKATKQISVYDDDHGALDSRLAVDNNIGQNNKFKYCAHTKCNEHFPWWAVDLGSIYYIERVVIYGRIDCCQRRLADFDILLYNPPIASWDTFENHNEQLCYRQKGISSSLLNVTCQSEVKGRYLKILKTKEIRDNCDALALCEVQVFGQEDINTSNVIHDEDAYRQKGISSSLLNVTCQSEVKGRYLKILKTKEIRDNCDALALCEVQVFGQEDINTSNVIHDEDAYRSKDIIEGITTQSEPMCPCACSYKQNRDYWSNADSSDHAKEELRQILAPKLKRLDKDLRINKTNLSRYRRRKLSADDNRKSAQILGIIGVVFLTSVIVSIVYSDVRAVLNGLTTTRNRHSLARIQHNPNV